MWLTGLLTVWDCAGWLKHLRNVLRIKHDTPETAAWGFLLQPWGFSSNWSFPAVTTVTLCLALNLGELMTEQGGRQPLLFDWCFRFPRQRTNPDDSVLFVMTGHFTVHQNAARLLVCLVTLVFLLINIQMFRWSWTSAELWRKLINACQSRSSWSSSLYEVSVTVFLVVTRRIAFYF